MGATIEATSGAAMLEIVREPIMPIIQILCRGWEM
jgi:hypothetical protein